MDYCIAASYSLLEIDGKMNVLDVYQENWRNLIDGQAKAFKRNYKGFFKFFLNFLLNKNNQNMLLFPLLG